MSKRTISYEAYYDKVYGGWIGKCIGGNIGALVENNKHLMDLSEKEVFTDNIPPHGSYWISNCCGLECWRKREFILNPRI